MNVMERHRSSSTPTLLRESLANEFELQCIDVSRKPEDYNEKFRKLIEYSEHGNITKKRKTQFDWSAIDKFMLK